MSEDSVALLRAKADAYRFLGAFMTLPGAHVAMGVADGSAGNDLEAIASELGLTGADGLSASFGELANEAQGEVDEVLSALRRDHTRLFTNPEKPLVAVYEASFKGADDFDTSRLAFVSPTAIDAERRYREVGLAVSDELRDSPDHMGAELEFMSFLHFEIAEAMVVADAERSVFLAERLDGFKEAHFLKWAEGFWAAVEGHAGTSVYRTLGRFGRRLAAIS